MKMGLSVWEEIVGVVEVGVEVGDLPSNVTR